MYNNVFIPVLSLTRSPVEVGGVCKIVLFKVEDVFQWPPLNPATGVIDGAVELKAGSIFYSLHSAEKNRVFTEEVKRAAWGPYTDIQLSFQKGGNSAANTLSLQRMLFHQWGIIISDRDGLQRLIGNRDCGAVLEFDYNSADPGSSRIRKIKFSWQHQLSAPIYTAPAFSVDPGGELIEVQGIITEEGEFILQEDGEKILPE